MMLINTDSIATKELLGNDSEILNFSQINYEKYDFGLYLFRIVIL